MAGTAVGDRHEASDRPEVLLETINPLDTTPDDLDALAEELQSRFPTVDFVPAYEDQHGAGVTWHEVIRIWVDVRQHIEDETINLIIDATLLWAVARFKKATGRSRPREVILQDTSTGKEIRVLVIDGEGKAPREETPSDIARRRPGPRHRT